MPDDGPSPSGIVVIKAPERFQQRNGGDHGLAKVWGHGGGIESFAAFPNRYPNPPNRSAKTTPRAITSKP
jgi:hypothetical protein